MKNGIYRVEFQAMENMGFGVITYRDGQVSGGDSSFAYVGQIEESGDQLSGQIEVFKHSPGLDNVFAGLESFTLTARGTATGDAAGLHCETASAPGVPLKVSMQLLRPL